MVAGELFTFQSVSVFHGPVRTLDRVDCAIGDGGVTVIIGPSGSGKSTLLRLCNRLDVPTLGRVSFRGDDVERIPATELRRRVGMVFQRPIPFPGSVADNLRIADPTATQRRIAAVLSRVGLEAGLAERAADVLSGGEVQRLTLARALLTDPEVMLMDEPTSSLDAGPAGALEDVGRSLADAGVPVLWVTHDVGQARRLADEVLVIIDGQAWGPAAPDALGGSPSAVQSFWSGRRAG